tara:strand:- start:4124 stop:4567 length:444 start_codon:yes stop_codon:yes gene_type:complete
MNKNEVKKINRKQAVEEMSKFLEKHDPKGFRRGEYSKDKILEDYVDVIEAIEDGKLVFDDHLVPTYEYYEPLFPDSNTRSEKDDACTLRSRVKAADKALVMDGLNFEKQRGTYALKMLSYLCQIEMYRVKELGSTDFNTLNQLCSVF